MSQNWFSPYGHIIDAGNDVLYQTWYAGTGTIFALYLYKSIDGGITFQQSDVKTIYSGSGSLTYTEPSMVNVGGGCFILLARINNYGCYRQFKSEDNCDTWSDQGYTSFETWSSDQFKQAPPFLSYINYEGVGIVACYYIVRIPIPSGNPPSLKVVYGLAKDLLNGANGWNLSPIKVIYTFPSGYTRSGYQSFFHPFNQYKGIGVCFEDYTFSETAYPLIKFTNISGMKDVLVALGL